MYTGWRNPIGCLKLQVILHKRATNHRSLLRKMTCKDKGSYGYSPPCTDTSSLLLDLKQVTTQVWTSTILSIEHLHVSCVRDGISVSHIVTTHCSVCCSVLQCVAVYCSVLQYATVCCSVLQCVVACCSVLQCVLRCVAVRCSVLQCVAECCSVLQCDAVCSSVLQCVAVCCSVLHVCIYICIYMYICTHICMHIYI